MITIAGYDAENIQPWTIAVVVSMTVLALLAVGLRLLSRFAARQRLWWDDWMILFSMAWNLAVVGFVLAMYASGMGLHATAVSTSSIVLMAKFLLVAEILYAWNLCWTKLSVLLMYFRIFRFSYFRTAGITIGTFVFA